MNTRTASSRVALRWLQAKPEYSNYLQRKKRQNKKPLSKEDWEAKVKPDEWGKETEPASRGEDSAGASSEPEEDYRAEGEAARPEAEAHKKKKLQEAQAEADATREQLKGVGLSEDERDELNAKLKKLDAIAAKLMGTSPEQYDEDRRDREPLEFRTLKDSGSNPKVTAAAKKYGLTDAHLKKFVDEVEGDPRLVKKKTRIRKEWRDYHRSMVKWEKAQAHPSDEAKSVSEPEKPDEPEPEDEPEPTLKQKFEAFKKHASPASKEKLKEMTLDEFEDFMEAWTGGKSRRASLRASVIRLAYTLSDDNLRARLVRVLT